MKKEKIKRLEVKNLNLKEHKSKILFLYTGIFLALILVGILLILLKNINPETSHIFPPCIIYKLTGIKCAGCGMTRAFHQILNLNFKEAFILNPLIFIYPIFIIYLIVKFFILKIQRKDINDIEDVLKKEIKVILYIALFIAVFFIIFRNIF